MNTLLKAIATRFGYWGLVFAAIGSAMLAYQFTRLYYQAEISGLQRDHAVALADQRADDVETLKLAKTHGDTLTLRLQTTESALTTKEKELRNAIASKTTGRACLSGDVVRLLNGAPADSAPGVPAPTPVTAATDGAAATDTDVAGWANYARTQYDTCRARLNALIDW